MRKRAIVFSIPAIISIILAGCINHPISPTSNNQPQNSSPFLNPTPTASSTLSIPSPYQKIVDSMRSLVDTLQIPASFDLQHTYPPDVLRTPDAFDVNEYFTVLDHLSMQPGYTLDYIYNKNGLQAEPYIYARRLNDPPIKTLSELTATVLPLDASGTITTDEWNTVLYSYLDHIQVDDTAQGFFQLIALRIMGSQFYLFWHAGYNDHTVVCDSDAMDKLLSSFQPVQDEGKLNLRKQLPQIDLSPKMELQKENVDIKIDTFTKWGGLMQREYVIARQFPHVVISTDTTTLIPYTWGLVN